MGSMASLGRAVSGLMASQRGLQVTAHNLANVNTKGYVRQRTNVKDSYYSTIGFQGNSVLQIGNGVDVSEIVQIRDIFLDRSYRNEASRKNFYAVQNSSTEEIESIFGETVGGDSFTNILSQLWNSMNELSKHPEGLEARGMFVQSASLFVDKANYIHEQLTDYQYNINSKISSTVDEVNKLSAKIANLNSKISAYEISGDNANDYRDERNNCLDRLSEIIDIQYREDMSGRVNVQAEGHSIVYGSDCVKMEVDTIGRETPFIKPVWADTKSDVFNMDSPMDSKHDNDKGELKGLMAVRGNYIADYTFMDKDLYSKIENSLVLKTQAKFDNLVHKIVTMINDKIAPYTSGAAPNKDEANAPYGLDGSRHIELFKRKEYDRYDKFGQYNIEQKPDASKNIFADKYTLYSAGNLEINPEIFNDLSKLELSKDKNSIGDNQLVQELITEWGKTSLKLNPDHQYSSNISDYYAGLVSEVGSTGLQAKNNMKNQTFLVNQIENQRNMISGVSTDEELGNMMKYQHAYNASARVVSVIDEMIKQIVTNMGLVGR